MCTYNYICIHTKVRNRLLVTGKLSIQEGKGKSRGATSFQKPKQLQAMLDIRNHAATLGAQVQRHTNTQCSENFCCRRAQKPHLELQAIESFCCRRAQKPESKASCRSLLDLAHGCSWAPVHPLGWDDRLGFGFGLGGPLWLLLRLCRAAILRRLLLDVLLLS